MNARGAAEDREGAAAPCLGFVVSPQTLTGPAALGHGLRVARRVDAILERETADPNRREQRTKLGGHPPSLPVLPWRSPPDHSGWPSRSSARSTLMRTPKPFFFGSRSFSGWTSRAQISSYTGPDLKISAVP